MPEARIVYGWHAVRAALERRADAVRELLIDPGRRDARQREIVRMAHVRGVRATEAESARLDHLAGTHRHQGVVARVDPAPNVADARELLAGAAEPALFLVLDGVQDPHNLGACLRVADAFGATAVIAPRDRAVGLTPVVAKVASGAAETVPYVTVTNLARQLRGLQEAGVWVVGTAHDAEADLDRARLAGPLAMVLGAEGEGLRRLTRDSCDEILRIPMTGTVGSLNVSVAAGVCLYECRRQRRLATRLST